MRILLAVIGACAIGLGGLWVVISPTAVQSASGLMVVLIGTVLFVGGAIISAIEVGARDGAKEVAREVARLYDDEGA